MSEQKVARILNHLAEQAAPSREIDLWPALQSRLQTSVAHPSKGSAMNAHRFLSPFLRPRTLVAIALVLAVGIFLALPQGRAWAQSLVRFFYPADSDVQPLPTAPGRLAAVTPGQSAATQTPVAGGGLEFEPECGPVVAPRCTPEQIQGRVSFPIRVFSEVPGDLRLAGATGGPDQVWLQYDSGPFTGGLLLVERSSPAAPGPQPIGASATVQPVSIGGVEGELVAGAWQDSGEGVMWTQDAGLLTLRWEKDGVSFELSAFSAREKTYLPEELVMLAEGLQAVPQGSSTPTPDAARVLSEAAVEKLAGFEIFTPQHIFQEYKLTQYSFTPESNTVCLHYLYAPLESEFHPVVYFLESPSLEVEPGSEGQQAGFPAAHPVALQGADDGQGWLAFQPSGKLGLCGNAPFWGGQLLSWRQKGMTYRIYAATNPAAAGYLSRQDLIEMAESLMGAAGTAEGSLDPWNLHNLADAQRLTGFPVKAPARLPPGTVFSHASYDPATGILTQVYSGFSVAAAQDVNDSLALCDAPGPIPSDAVQEVQVNGQPAQYSQGGWVSSSASPARWEKSIAGEYLAWQADGVGYCLQAAVEIASARDTLVQVAESIQ